MEIIEEEQRRRGASQILDHFILLRESGDEVTLRFLDEFEGKDEQDKRVAHTFKVHHFGGAGTKDPYQAILCGGVGCQLCTDNPPRVHVVFRAWVYDDKTVKLFDAKARSDVILDLVEHVKQYGSITNADYVFKRRGKQMDTRYFLLRQEKMPLSEKLKKRIKAEWLSSKRVRELIEARYRPWEKRTTEEE
jgi:hypothetical protein